MDEGDGGKAAIRRGYWKFGSESAWCCIFVSFWASTGHSLGNTGKGVAPSTRMDNGNSPTLQLVAYVPLL